MLCSMLLFVLLFYLCFMIDYDIEDIEDIEIDAIALSYAIMDLIDDKKHQRNMSPSFFYINLIDYLINQPYFNN